MFDTVLAALTPYIFEAISLVIAGVIAMIGTAYRKATGKQIERAHADALHSALLTGIHHALARHLSGERAVKSAVAYASTIGAPDAVAHFGLGKDVIEMLGVAKLHEVTGMEINEPQATPMPPRK